MKFTYTLAISALLVSATAPIAPVLADPTVAPGQNGSSSGLLSFCEGELTSGDFASALNFGRCMGFNLVSDEGFVAQICMAFRSENLLADFGFASFDDCVSTLQQEYEGVS